MKKYKNAGKIFSCGWIIQCRTHRTKLSEQVQKYAIRFPCCEPTRLPLECQQMANIPFLSIRQGVFFPWEDDCYFLLHKMLRRITESSNSCYCFPGLFDPTLLSSLCSLKSWWPFYVSPSCWTTPLNSGDELYHGLVTLAASGTQVRPGLQQCKSLGLALPPWHMYGSAVGRYSTLKYFTDYDALKSV